jgi:plastocyanin
VNAKRTVNRRRFAAAGLALGLVFAGCGGSDGGSTASSDPQSNTVSLKLIAFKPERLTVKAGTTVTWKNEDGTEHSVTSGTVKQGSSGVTNATDGMFDSGLFGQNKTFTFTFTSPGTYPYFCTLHPATMRGEITVT